MMNHSYPEKKLEIMMTVFQLNVPEIVKTNPSKTHTKTPKMISLVMSEVVVEENK